MDYQKAKERLDRRPRQEKKRLGHKLQSHRLPEFTPTDEDVENERPIALQYFQTDILTFFPDGGCKLDAGNWLTSQCTLDKFNKFLPYGWKLLTYRTRWCDKLVGMLVKRDDNGNIKQSIPYRQYIKIFPHGRQDLDELNRMNYLNLLEQVRNYAWCLAEDVMNGKVGRPNGRDQDDYRRLRAATATGQADPEGLTPGQIMLLVLDKSSESFTQPAFLQALRHTMTFNNTSELDLYYREVYNLTAKPKTLRQKIAQIEGWMRQGKQLENRPGRNHPNHFDLRNEIRDEAERFLLQGLEFELLEPRRR